MLVKNTSLAVIDIRQSKQIWPLLSFIIMPVQVFIDVAKEILKNILLFCKQNETHTITIYLGRDRHYMQKFLYIISSPLEFKTCVCFILRTLYSKQQINKFLYYNLVWTNILILHFQYLCTFRSIASCLLHIKNI